MKIRKAVIPVGGFGTRFLPATKAQPKAMLPIVDKPVIQYLVEEAVSAGIKEIIIISGRGKRSIEDHFDVSFELESNLKSNNKLELLKEMEKISNLARFIYVRQAYPNGDGDAILHAKEIIGNEPFLVLFGDDIVDYKISAAKQIISVFEKYQNPIIAVEEVPRKEVQSYGIVDPDIEVSPNTYKIKNFVEKPKPELAPSNLGVIGKYVLTPDIFETLETLEVKTSQDGELRLADAFLNLINKRYIYCHKIKGKRYDTGDKFGWLKANIDFALKDKILEKKVYNFLKQKLNEYK